jgi:hypothetical protein
MARGVAWIFGVVNEAAWPRKLSLVSQLAWLSRTGAERTLVREHRKRRKARQMAARLGFHPSRMSCQASVKGFLRNVAQKKFIE